MSSRDRQIDLDEAMAGMTLSDDILDAHGGVLLASGAILTEAALSALRRRGIEQLLVVREELAAADPAPERDRLQPRLERLFRRCRNQQASELLLQSILQYRVDATA